MPINWNMLDTQQPQKLAALFDPQMIAMRNAEMERNNLSSLSSEAQLMGQIEQMRQAPLVREQQAQERAYQMQERQRMAQERKRQEEQQAAENARREEIMVQLSPQQQQLLRMGVPAEKVLIEKPMEAPKTRTYKMGDAEVTEEWNPQTGKWTKIAEGGRWRPQTVVVNGGTATAKEPKPIYDTASNEWVYPPSEEFPQGRRTGDVGKQNALSAAVTLINEFKGSKDAPGPIYTTPTGGILGLTGQLSKVTDTQKVKDFNNLKESLSTQLRAIMRIPGEGALSDKEQAQYGLQLPDIGNDPSVNEKILNRIQTTMGMRASSTPVAPNQAPVQSQRTVVKTGTHNGRKVIQYSDGSVDYAN